MTKDEILKYLTLLGQRLKDRDETGEILLTGGASMPLVHSARDMTKDVDALYEPRSSINEIAEQIAAEYDLDPEWLNDSVKGFVGANAPMDSFMQLDGLTINTVSADYLLAMKLMSARYGETDRKDIEFLLNKLDVRNADDAFGILLKYWPQKMVTPKTMYVIEEFFDGE
jgi:hypothetical protein